MLCVFYKDLLHYEVCSHLNFKSNLAFVLKRIYTSASSSDSCRSVVSQLGSTCRVTQPTAEGKLQRETQARQLGPRLDLMQYFDYMWSLMLGDISRWVLTHRTFSFPEVSTLVGA